MATYKSIKYNIDYAGKAGSLMPLATFTSDGSDSNATFTSGINSTYDEYWCICNDIHSESDFKYFGFQGTTDGSNFNITTTSTHFISNHAEADNATGLSYEAGADVGQVTTTIPIVYGVGNDNDQSVSGIIKIYNPSSTTYVKHWLSMMHTSLDNDRSSSSFASGYLNTASAVTGFRFLFQADEIQGGTIQLFGVI